MTGVVCGTVPQVCRKYICCILAICWLSGLFYGIFVFYYAESSVVSLMRRTLVSSVSIVGLLSNLLIPFLFTVYAVYYSMSWLLFPVCFWEAFSVSFVMTGVCMAFGSAGWLVRSMILLCMLIKR